MILTAIIFIVLGVLIKYGKMYFLIAGYNTMSKKEKEKYDIKGIATVFKNAMFGMAFMIIIGYCLSLFLKNLCDSKLCFLDFYSRRNPILNSEIKFKRI